MRDQVLLKVTVITDDDTGMYQVGELDFGVPTTTKDYLEKPGNREKLADWLQTLSNRCRNSQPPFGPNLTHEQREQLAQQLGDAKLPNHAT